MTPWVLRRLLLVGALAFAAWLLGGTGQAHAAPGEGPGPGPGAAAIGSLRHSDAPAKTLAGGGAVRLVTAAVRPSHGIVRRVVPSAVSAGELVRRARALERVATSPTGHRGADVASAPRHRGVEVSGDRMGPRHRHVHAHGARRGAAPPATVVAATDTGRGGHANARTAPATPAPPVAFPCGATGERGALPSPGSASAGGPATAGHTARPAAAPRRSVALISVLGAVPPAVRTATDEPAVSPD
ncbi:MAG TPA: hypothetical protein VFU43_02420 [Streptosporangiaceae bacterium]|nr:hypothetical protein [Streptosporangiaceae bacterium]